MSGGSILDVVVSRVDDVNEYVRRFEFTRPDGTALPAFSGGSHVVVTMEDDDAKRLNPYSLMSDPADLSHYAISVRRDDQGRGGSVFMHHRIEPGTRMQISQPVNLFPIDWRARKHLLLAAGIGITPFMSQTAQLAQEGADFELHYLTRSPDVCSYGEDLVETYGERVSLYYSRSGSGLDVTALLSAQPVGTHLYVCGPVGLIEMVMNTARELGWPEGALHFEEFLAPPVGEPFTVQAATSGKTIEVGGEQSLLEALEAADIDAPFLCRGGACGQCETPVLECDGEIEHNDFWLNDQERESNTKIMPCVSRFKGRSLVIDR